MYVSDGTLFRQVNDLYAADYDLFMGSGLYAALTSCSWLVPHEEVHPAPPRAHRILKPAPVPYVS